VTLKKSSFILQFARSAHAERDRNANFYIVPCFVELYKTDSWKKQVDSWKKQADSWKKQADSWKKQAGCLFH